MIIKSLSRKTPSYKQLIDYVLKEQNDPVPPGLERFVYTRNLREDKDHWHHEFEENESFRIRRHSRQVYCYHEVISFNPRDSGAITTDMLKTFADEYCKRRGIALSIAIPHYGNKANNIHLHIIFSGVEYKTGKALRISRQDFSQIKQDMQDIQRERFSEIVHSIANHGKKEKIRTSEKAVQFAKRTGKVQEREELRLIVEQYLSMVASTEELKEALEQEGITLYERAGTLQGIRSSHSQRKYRFTSLVGNRVKDLELKKSHEQEILASLARIRDKQKDRGMERES